MQLARLVFLSVVLLPVLSACGPDYVYEKNYAIEEAAWAYTDTLQFQFEVEDTNTIYNLWLEVDHSTYLRQSEPVHADSYAISLWSAHHGVTLLRAG